MLSGTKNIFNALRDSDKRSCILRKMKLATLITIPATFSIAWISQGIRYGIKSALNCESVVNFSNNYIHDYKFNCHLEKICKRHPRLQHVGEYKVQSGCDNDASSTINNCDTRLVCCSLLELSNVTMVANAYVEIERSINKDHAKIDFQTSWPLTFFAVPVSCIIGPIIGLYLGYREVNSGEWILEHEMKNFSFSIQKLIFEYLEESLARITDLRTPLLSEEEVAVDVFQR